MKTFHSPGMSKLELALSIVYGGHGGVTAQEACDNLSVLTVSMLGAPLGAAVLSLGGIKASEIEGGASDPGNPTLKGPTSIQVDQEDFYTITNYDSFTQYIVQATRGSAFRTTNRVYFGSDTVGLSTLSVNGTTITINVTPDVPTDCELFQCYPQVVQCSECTQCDPAPQCGQCTQCSQCSECDWSLRDCVQCEDCLIKDVPTLQCLPNYLDCFHDQCSECTQCNPVPQCSECTDTPQCSLSQCTESQCDPAPQCTTPAQCAECSGQCDQCILTQCTPSQCIKTQCTECEGQCRECTECDTCNCTCGDCNTCTDCDVG